jgi:2,5-diketo-D-gluconate reductase A
MDEPIIQAIADKHGKTYAQIMLRWLVEQGLVILPKSVTPSRIKENFEVFDFKLDDEDLEKIAPLERGMRTCWSPVHVP